MRNPRDFTKAVAACQTFVTVFYLLVGILVYMYAGQVRRRLPFSPPFLFSDFSPFSTQYVASPALGTAGVLIKRVAYGLALPGLLAAAVIYTHLPAKVSSDPFKLLLRALSLLRQR